MGAKLGKREQVARRQTCRPPAQGHPDTPALVLRLEDVSTGPYCGCAEFLLLPPGSLGSPTGEVHAWHGEMVFFALEAELMAPSVAHV